MSLDLSLKNYQFNFKVTNLRDNRIYEFEDFRLDAAHLLLYRDGEQVSLTPKAIETLLALLERRGEVVGKDELMQAIWADTVVEESNLSQYLHILRKTLGASTDGKPFIETLKRRGYRFNGAVRVSENSNGFSSQIRADAEEIENFKPEKTNGRQSETSDSRFLRVERRGNVLALADWKGDGEKPDEFRRAAEQNQERRHRLTFDSKTKSRFAFLAACAALLLATVSFAWFKSASSARLSAMKGETTILNLTNGENVIQATISPDGKYFVYTEQDVEASHLLVRQVGGANRVEIIEPFRGMISNLTFAPDSQSIYFLAVQKSDESNSLYRVPTLGGVPTRILTDINSSVSFSPDGSEMVFVRSDENNQSQLIVAANDGKRERILLTRQAPEFIRSNAAWSPDGKTIAFGLGKTKPGEINGDCTIVEIDLANETIRTLSSEEWDSCYRMAWTPDGEDLVFVGTKYKESLSPRRDQLYYLSLESSESRRLTAADGRRYEPASLGVTDAGEILALPTDRASQIWALDASGDSRSAIQITNGETDGRGGIAPLTDGRIGFLSRAGDGFAVWMADADGANRRQLTSDPQTVEELRAAPDGRFFVFAAKADGFAHLFRIDTDGANLRQLTFGESVETDSTVSPDGNWIVYASSVFDGKRYRLGLWKISSSGGASAQLSDRFCYTPHFSPDGRFVSCIDGDKIHLVSTEDGSFVKTFETPKNSVLNVGARWTPDGQNLVYNVYQKGVCNLWRQPTDGGSPRPLTDFSSSDIYNFAFTTDGSRLYVARGNQIRNAVLIKNFR